jgi:hypothetical protein
LSSYFYRFTFALVSSPNTINKLTMISCKRTPKHSILLRVTALALITTATALTFFAVAVAAQKRKPARHPSICGDPTAACKTSGTFQPNDLPFRLPRNAVIYDTDLFYAIILKSVNVPEDNCDTFVPESDRLAAQALFPDHKVFSSRCVEPGEVSYTNTSAKARFMAVYAGMTLADANRMLAAAKATGKFPGANIRRMRAAINGT